MKYLVKTQIDHTTSTGVKFVFRNPTGEEMDNCFYYEHPTMFQVSSGRAYERKYIQKPLELAYLTCIRIEGLEVEEEVYIKGKEEPQIKTKKIEKWEDFIKYDFQKERIEISTFMLSLKSVIDKKK